jgi:hypothetical protein
MSSIVNPNNELAQETNLLQRFERDVALAGLVGEKNNAKVILMAAASAKLDRPLNINVGGSSSSGKNHLIGRVASFIPDEYKKNLTGMSPKALMHSAEDEYQHKAVFIAEYEGAAGADYAIRTMQSEKVIEWEFVDTSHGIKTQKRKVNGPVAFIQATTRVTLHPENETRLLFLEMDESKDQTRAITERQAMEAAGVKQSIPDDLFSKWHDFFKSLKADPVIILFAKQLAEAFPNERVRSRRDFPKLLGLIEVSAYLHQNQRGYRGNSILAAPQDYQIAKHLFEHCYYTGPDKEVGKLLEAAESSYEFTVADMMLQLPWKKSKMYQVLGRAEELGCVAETGEKRGTYRFLQKHSESPLKLPERVKVSSGDLRAEFFRNSTKVPPSQTVIDEVNKQTLTDNKGFNTENDFRMGEGEYVRGNMENESHPVPQSGELTRLQQLDLVN